MARTKRKVNPVMPVTAKTAPPQRVYKTSGYVRLSIEDSGKPGADTIEAQREIVASYIESQPDMRLVDIYCDNGHTGTNFQRPAFDRLMDDVRAGKVDCIVVKDLSRFGRNYKETGNYLERIFPYLDVRFVAVSDNFDTIKGGYNDSYMMPLTNILNESYSRDISRKVSSAIKSQQLNGDFKGVFAPYGYAKSPENHRKLVVNPDTALVVAEIFALRVSGMGYARISRHLNDRGIPAPGAYLYQQGQTQRETYRDALWTPWNIKEILNNPVYLGHLVQGKRTNESYKKPRKERYAPKEEWRVVYNTHEPIIREEVFARVQELAKQSRADYQKIIGKHEDLKSPNLFRKLIFCGDCGKCLVRQHIYSNWAHNKEYYYNYRCTTNLKMTSACTPKNLKETHLLEVVRDTIQQHLAVVAKLRERVLREYSTVSSEKRKAIDQQMQREKLACSRTKSFLDRLYQNLAEGVIDREEYTSMKEHYHEQLAGSRLRLEGLQEQLKAMERCGPANPVFAAYEAYQNAGLTEELIHALISRINVFDGGRLEITLAYQNELQELSRFWEGRAAS